MIVYLEKKFQFLADVDSNVIELRIREGFVRTHGHAVGASELSSWKNSMQYMHRILADPEIPDDAGVAIELGIPMSAKRMDIVLTGRSDSNRQTAVIIELKQWSEVARTGKDALVRTVMGGAPVETLHPSYQAWTYAALLEGYSETVRDRDMFLQPCAYLHNLPSGEVIHHDFYKEHTDRAPAFLRGDAEKLRTFLKKHVRYGDDGQAIYQIRDGKIRPSKSLADSLVALLQGSREFIMIDDQKIVYETALKLADEAALGKKQVLLVEGGPGTGKSVVAINLLVELTNRGKVVQYVTKNAAPRAVYEATLTKSFRKSHISSLFVSSGGFTEGKENVFDALVVDEAHRLNEKSGLYGNLGENQTKELIGAAKFTVFFLDENQRVTLRDNGSVDEITRRAKAAGATLHRLQLASQFRCNGSDGYLAWVDNTLGIRATANESLEGIPYEFAVYDSADELKNAIVAKNFGRNKARIVAGYCWDWTSKNDPKAYDIEIGSFRARWNLSEHGSLWIISPESVSEVGCIHTCQGLELEYVGVILGPDFLVRDGVIQTDPSARSRQDQSVKGLKAMAKTSPEDARLVADQIIKNTYRTLMTRGLRGCFVYSVDPETNAYFKSASSARPAARQAPEKYPGLRQRVLLAEEVRPYENCLPIYALEIAAGGFGEHQLSSDCDWVELPDSFVARHGYFVARVVGESMNRRIPNGSWCVFSRDIAGSRNGKVVLAELLDRQDPESGGRYTVKVYESRKVSPSGTDEWRHDSILLKPDSTSGGYKPLEFSENPLESLRIIGEYKATLP